MQKTELDSVVAATLAKAKENALTLVIANKNYSSWSMRAWLVLVAFDIPFKEVRILLDQPDTGSQIASFSAAGCVPVLCDGELRVWDSLAICEYMAEQFPQRQLWPQSTVARAIARSICAEMHSGFIGLRSAMPMNIREKFSGQGHTAQAQGDIGRICEIWEDCLAQFGHHEFLFGEFSIADAFFAPVVMRFRTYQVSLAPALRAYADRVAAHPAVARWIAEALLETEVLSRQ